MAKPAPPVTTVTGSVDLSIASFPLSALDSQYLQVAFSLGFSSVIVCFIAGYWIGTILKMR